MEHWLWDIVAETHLTITWWFLLPNVKRRMASERSFVYLRFKSLACLCLPTPFAVLDSVCASVDFIWVFVYPPHYTLVCLDTIIFLVTLYLFWWKTDIFIWNMVRGVAFPMYYTAQSRICISPRLCFYQTRSAWSMDQGSNKKHSAVHNFAPTVTNFCVLKAVEWFLFDPWSLDQADLVW